MCEPMPNTNRGAREKLFMACVPKGFRVERMRLLQPIPSRRSKAALEALVERRRAELPAKRERVIRFLVSRGFAVNDILRALEEAEGR